MILSNKELKKAVRKLPEEHKQKVTAIASRIGESLLYQKLCYKDVQIILSLVDEQMQEAQFVAVEPWFGCNLDAKKVADRKEAQALVEELCKRIEEVYPVKQCQ